MATWNPIVFWRDWWRSLSLTERLVVAGIAVAAICIVYISPAFAADNPSDNQAVWIALIAAVPLALSGPFIAWLNERSRRRDRAEDRAERDAISERQRIAAERAEHIATAIAKIGDNVALVERNTNSISTRNEQIATALGVEEGIKKQKLISEELAKTLLTGQQQGGATERASVAATAAIPTEPKS